MSRASDYSKMINSLAFHIKRRIGPDGPLDLIPALIINQKGNLAPPCNISSYYELNPKEALELRDWLTEMFDESTSAGNG